MQATNFHFKNFLTIRAKNLAQFAKTAFSDEWSKPIDYLDHANFRFWILDFGGFFTSSPAPCGQNKSNTDTKKLTNANKSWLLSKILASLTQI
ncbi:hypothetical protein H5968_11360 [Sphaerospermopsis sp. LEGE 00249]|uniref:hypothetical protein n=1 Tax=Sphaerospermopsis sp. LEGE 00249 TaxID=1380707 RepID=UPI00164D24E1|nr:hypothetical protein [Sphaerospermopsis sp. LEGE 00249]MBC5795727.1 hypothetical protein [Sphaerospermopsis sp. LEGE 00249]